MGILEAARKTFGTFNVWSLNGEIYACCNDQRFHLRSKHEIDLIDA